MHAFFAVCVSLFRSELMLARLHVCLLCMQSWHAMRLSASTEQLLSVGYALVEPVQRSLIDWHLESDDGWHLPLSGTTKAATDTEATSGGELWGPFLRLRWLA